MEHNIYTNSHLDKLEHVNVSVLLVQVCELRITWFQGIRCYTFFTSKLKTIVTLFYFIIIFVIHIIIYTLFFYTVPSTCYEPFIHRMNKIVKEDIF